MGADDGAPVLLTGATGFVGGHVAEALAAAGHALRCTVRSSSDTRRLTALEPRLVSLDFSLELSDRRDLLAEALDGVEAVVHVAGLTRAAREVDFHRVNVEGTAALAEAAREAGVRRFVFLSSLAARGPDGHAGPTSAYGCSKREAERRLASASEGMETVVLRPAGVYGPRDRDMVPLFRAAARGWLPAPSGGAPLQPVYVTDVAGATVRALVAPTGGGPYPVAEPARYRWEDVAGYLSAAFGRRVRTVRLPGLVYEAAGRLGEVVAAARGRAPEFDRRRARDLARHGWTCDVTATKEGLGWRARVPLEEGIRRTAAWYRETGWL